MILSYAGMAFLLYAFARLRGEIESLKQKVNWLELSALLRDGAGLRYKPQLTIHEQIAEELHLLICDEKNN